MSQKRITAFDAAKELTEAKCNSLRFEYQGVKHRARFCRPPCDFCLKLWYETVEGCPPPEDELERAYPCYWEAEYVSGGKEVDDE